MPYNITIDDIFKTPEPIKPPEFFRYEIAILPENEIIFPIFYKSDDIRTPPVAYFNKIDRTNKEWAIKGEEVFRLTYELLTSLQSGIPFQVTPASLSGYIADPKQALIAALPKIYHNKLQNRSYIGFIFFIDNLSAYKV